MAQVINTNVASLNSQRALTRSQSALNLSLARLSSGLRINSAKDDAAGLAISERFTTQIRGLNQAARNASDAISLAQTGEGALQEVTTALQRMRELAVQSINATNSDLDRASLQAEVAQLQEEITRVSGTEFNGVQIIGVSAQAFTFQVGANAGETITISTTNVTTLSGYAGAISGGTISTVSGANSLLANVDTYLDEINSVRATLGAIQNRFEAVVRNTQNVAENLSASRSRIQDADFAAETAALTRAQILQQAGVAMLSQANALPQSVLSLIG
ncbi:MAG: flagellin [Gammaproteobacteria bacterium]|nr:flagellin [Gammaproteobacteria bacterium]MDH5801324.1 flagellin [Gammaproteobacteria bacterium]